MGCSKKSYPTNQLAEDALIEARITFDYPKNGGPIAVYPCEDCGQYHLTSQGSMNERLAGLLSSGAIGKLKQANEWEKKLKKR